jgi:hypothetical protein
MVSPTPATTAHPPVLSYAESAKKAQGVKPPSLQAQKHLSNPPRQPAPPAFAAEPKKPLAPRALTSPRIPQTVNQRHRSRILEKYLPMIHRPLASHRQPRLLNLPLQRQRPCPMCGIRGFSNGRRRDHNLDLRSLFHKRPHPMCPLPRLLLRIRLPPPRVCGNQMS